MQSPVQWINQLGQCRVLCLKSGVLLLLVLLPVSASFPFWLACDSALPSLTLYFWLVPISYGGYGFVMIANAAFNGVGVPLNGFVVSFMRCIGLVLPLSWMLTAIAGANGVFLAISLSNFIAAVIAYRLLRRTLINNQGPALTVVSPTIE